MYKYNFIRKLYIKTAEVDDREFAPSQSTKTEVVPCSQCTKIKVMVKQTHERIFKKCHEMFEKVCLEFRT